MEKPITICERKNCRNAKDMHGKVYPDFVPFAVRGPKFIQLKSGVLLFFCGTKFTSQLDEEPGCKMVMRSLDDGKTWCDPILLTYDGAPHDIRLVPVYDEIHDEIVLFAWTRYWKPGCEKDHLLAEIDMIENRVYQRFWLSRSKDEGLTWSDYREIAVSGIPEEWTVKSFLTPGIGIQLKNQKDLSLNGRFIVPTNHAEMNDGQNEFRAHLMLSDDFGESWRVGAVQTYLGSNESVVVELNDGTVIHNCRNQGGTPENRRIQGFSHDGGETLIDSGITETLFDPICHAGFAKADVGGKEYVFFSAPRSEHLRNRIIFGTPLKWGRRECLTIYGSKDGGRSYKPIKQVTDKGQFSAYSMIYPTASGKLLCAWETGPELDLYREIKYTVFSLEELVALCENEE